MKKGEVINKIVDIMRYVEAEDVELEISEVLGQEELTDEQTLLYRSACTEVDDYVANHEADPETGWSEEQLAEQDKIAEKMAEKMIDCRPTIGNRIKQARENARLSQVELAHLAGTRQSQVTRWESDEAEPSISFLKKITKATGCDMLWLIGE